MTKNGVIFLFILFCFVKHQPKDRRGEKEPTKEEVILFMQSGVTVSDDNTTKDKCRMAKPIRHLKPKSLNRNMLC